MLDGTEHYCSKKLHCPHCSQRKRSDGKLEYFHSFLAATVVAPGHARVLPLPPEFITPQDGAEKQDCENAAAKRWLARHGASLASYRPVYLGDDLYAHQPLAEAIHASGGNFILTCKPSSHGKRTYRNSFVTDLTVSAETAAELATCGCARWKIENETFNVLKTGGYNLEHNFGNGKKTLANLLVTLNLLAFSFHAVSQIAVLAWRNAVAARGASYRFFEHPRTITTYVIFPY